LCGLIKGERDMTKKTEQKEKATFSLDVVVKDQLEDGWLMLRRMLKGRCICKSAIVEESIKMVLDDLKKNKESSKIYKILSKD